MITKFLHRAALLLVALPAVGAAQASIITPGGIPIQVFGQPGFHTYVFGETFRTPDAINTNLTSFEFFLMPVVDNNGSPIPLPAVGTFQAFVYQFGTNALIGPALFQSAVMNLPVPAANGTPVNVFTGGTQLTAGVQYVAFFKALTGTTGGDAFAANSTGANGPYANGQFVSSNDANPAFFSTSFTNLDLQMDLEFTRGQTLTSTPEPASLALMATGLIAVVGVARRRNRR